MYKLFIAPSKRGIATANTSSELFEKFDVEIKILRFFFKPALICFYTVVAFVSLSFNYISLLLLLFYIVSIYQAGVV